MTPALEHLDPPTLVRALLIIKSGGIVTTRNLGWLLWHRRDRTERARLVARKLSHTGFIHFVQNGPGRTGWTLTEGTP